MIKTVFQLLLLLSCVASSAYAADKSMRKTPYYLSLRSDKVYVRFGPSYDYPVKWVYTRQHLPVEVIHVFEGWRKVKFPDGEQGWVNHTLLSSERSAIVQGNNIVILTRKADVTSGQIARVQPGAIVLVDRCEQGKCRVKAGEKDDIAGWIAQSLLWGVYMDEQIP